MHQYTRGKACAARRPATVAPVCCDDDVMANYRANCSSQNVKSRAAVCSGGGVYCRVSRKKLFKSNTRILGMRFPTLVPIYTRFLTLSITNVAK